MKWLVAAFVAVSISAFSILGATPSQAGPRVVAKIDLSQQKMRVYVNGRQSYTWKVSTGRRGYRTPVGSWRPKFLKRMHYSSKYYNSPMPHSIFFLGGYAIHGTDAIRRLGRPASHGCIRLHPKAARKLFALVKRHGRRNSRIVITR